MPTFEQTFYSPGRFFSLSDHALNLWYWHVLDNTSTLNTISNILLAAFDTAREADGVLPSYVTNMASMLTVFTHSDVSFFIEERYIQDISLVCDTRRTQLILASQRATEDYEKLLAAAREKATQKAQAKRTDTCQPIRVPLPFPSFHWIFTQTSSHLSPLKTSFNNSPFNMKPILNLFVLPLEIPGLVTSLHKTIPRPNPARPNNSVYVERCWVGWDDYSYGRGR